MFLRSLFITALLAFSPLAFSQTSSLVVQGATGDWITGGRTIDVTGLTATASSDGRVVSFSYWGESEWWYLDFSVPSGQKLQVGAYANATRHPFNFNGPGLSLSGTGRGCNTLSGRFAVLELKLGPAGSVEKFRATFSQSCEGFLPAALGEVVYEDTTTQPALQVAVTHLPEANLLSNRAEARLRFEVTCSANVALNVNGTLKQRLNRRTVLSGPVSFSTACGPTPTIVETPIYVASHPGRRWTRGNAQLDTVASAFDAYYGTDVTDTDATVVRLKPIR